MKKGNRIGGWAFLIGVILAVIFGVMGNLTGNYAMILVVIGLIVGFLNVADEEAEPFLLSGVALIIASALGGSAIGSASVMLDNVLTALLAIFVPATIIVAIKNVFGLAKH